MFRSQFLIAVFDDWDTLIRVLGDVGAKDGDYTTVLMHKRGDAPLAETNSSWLLRDTTELRFAASVPYISCTTGKLANALAARVAGGARSLTEALIGWLTSDQARELEWHIERGRLVLWLRPATSEALRTVSAQLVQASPHLVGLCAVDLEP